MTKFNEYLALLEELYTETEQAFGKLPVDNNDKVEMIMAALYASIFAFADSAIFLLKNEREAGLSAIGRSTLEAWVDMKNLEKDPQHADNMQASYYYEYIRMLDDGVTGTNPYSAGFANNPQVTQALTDFKTRLDKLKAQGAKPKTDIKAKFAEVGMLNAYMAIYNTLCSEGHNNIRALQERHFEAANGRIEIVVFKPQRESHMLAMIDLYIDPLCSGIAMLYQRRGLILPSSLTALEQRLDAFRATI